jgi:hypothetical protein
MKNTHKNHTYLAGPMEDVSVDHMTSWRILASERLDAAGIDYLDPTRRVSFHDQLKGVDYLQEVVKGMNICKRIFKQDLEDIASSKVMLVDARRSSGKGTGTAMETMFAHTKNKIIIIWCDPEDPPHPFYEAMYSEKHYTLEDAIDAVMEYY